MRTLSAYLCLVSGIALCTASFCVSENHTVDDSLLFYFGECLIYAGGIFNIKLLVIKTVKDLIKKDTPKQ